MRVDLLVPRFPPAHWNFAFAMDVEGSRYSHPPLGVATLAAHTPEGVDVRRVDLSSELQILAYHEQRKSGLPTTEVTA